MNVPGGTAASGSVSGHLILPQNTAKIAAAQRHITAPPAATADPQNVIPGELVVRFEDTVTDDECACILAEHGMHEIECSPSGLCRVSCPPRAEPDEQHARLDTLNDAKRLRARNGVRRADANQRRWIAQPPNDPYFSMQWNFSMINLPQAWDITTGSDDVIVAVVDTGILSGHPDFAGRLVAGYD